jgi:hypothetical protein
MLAACGGENPLDGGAARYHRALDREKSWQPYKNDELITTTLLEYKLYITQRSTECRVSSELPFILVVVSNAILLR